MSKKRSVIASKMNPVRNLPAVVLAAASMMAAWAQKVTPPPTPAAITPPAGNKAFLVGHAIGTQGYICLPASAGGTSWTVNNSRPEATLFKDQSGRQILTHFTSINTSPKSGVTASPSGNPTWQSSSDTSKVWGKVGNSIAAGPETKSCPNQGAIPCLLLEAIGNEKGPSGGHLLAEVTFIQRLNTKEGAAPTSACTVGQTQLVPYTADYYFYKKKK